MECGKMKINKSERKPHWQTKPSQPKFEPTDEQRGWVSAMAGLRMTHEEMCRIIVNPHTSRYICCETLIKAFPDELAGGRARLKHRLCTNITHNCNAKLVKRIDAGDCYSVRVPARLWLEGQGCQWRRRRCLAASSGSACRDACGVGQGIGPAHRPELQVQ
jgi:hypothetical protein